MSSRGEQLVKEATRKSSRQIIRNKKYDNDNDNSDIINIKNPNVVGNSAENNVNIIGQKDVGELFRKLQNSKGFNIKAVNKLEDTISTIKKEISQLNEKVSDDMEIDDSISIIYNDDDTISLIDVSNNDTVKTSPETSRFVIQNLTPEENKKPVKILNFVPAATTTTKTTAPVLNIVPAATKTTTPIPEEKICDYTKLAPKGITILPVKSKLTPEEKKCTSKKLNPGAISIFSKRPISENLKPLLQERKFSQKKIVQTDRQPVSKKFTPEQEKFVQTKPTIEQRISHRMNTAPEIPKYVSSNYEANNIENGYDSSGEEFLTSGKENFPNGSNRNEDSQTFTHDEYYYFGNNVCAQLRTLPMERALRCQAKIMEVLLNERIEFNRARQISVNRSNNLVRPQALPTKMRRTSVNGNMQTKPAPKPLGKRRYSNMCQ